MVTSIFAYKGSQYIGYGLTSLHSPWIIHDAIQKINHAPIMVRGRWILGASSDAVESIMDY